MEREQVILAYLGEHRTMTLSICDEDGPHGVSLFYLNKGFSIFFISDPESRHALCLARSPQAAVTVSDHYAHWAEIRGVQMKGRVRFLGGYLKNINLVMDYSAKFPEVKELFFPSRDLSTILWQKISRGVFYEFLSEEVCFIDNTEGFGYRDRLLLAL